ncbi:MAG TPA: transposase [Nocardioidaceae bacterium]|nr:transposase [Nocardioidaceae bacterium]
MKRTSWSSGLAVTADGVGVVAHAGSVATRLLADRTGLTSELSKAMARRSFAPVHDRGRVLVDVAVMLADGGEAIADIDVLRHQAGVLGPVASPPTVWRTLDEATPGRLKRIAAARARVRRHVWAQLGDGAPASRVAGVDLGETIVLDVDATIVVAHSEKENAAATFKHTFGFHPLGVWCDNTREFLAAKLRAGNAGSNTAVDHIEVLTDAIAQVPRTHRRRLLIRSDGAGASHALLDWLHARAAYAAGVWSTPLGSRSPRSSARRSCCSPTGRGSLPSRPTGSSARAATSPN